MSYSRKPILASVFAVFMLLTTALCFNSAQAAPTLDINTDSDGTAVKGYDLVSYFDVEGPKEGIDKFSHTVKGATYLFSSAENLSKFKKNPRAYLPAYGGFCSYGVVLGKKFDVSPDAWRIVDNVLFLQLDKGTRLIWEEDREKNIEISDRNWPSIQNIPANDL